MFDIDPAYMELVKKYQGQKSKYMAVIFEKLLSVEEAKAVLTLPVSSKEELAEKMNWTSEEAEVKTQKLYEKGVLYFTKKGIQ